MAEHDLVDVARRDAGVAERLGRNSHDQALDRLALEPAEGRVRPSNDASRHGGLLVQRIWVRRHRMSRNRTGQKSENPKTPSVKSASVIKRFPIRSRRVSAVPPPRLP